MNQTRIHKRRWRCTRLIAFSLFALAGPLATTGTLVGQEGGAAKAPEKWAVVEVNGDARVIASAEVRGLRAKLETEWKEAVQRHKAAAKAAAKAKEKFSDEKPIRPRFKVIKDGFKTEQDATAALDALKAKRGGSAARGGGKSSSFTVVRVGSELRVVASDGLKRLRQDVAFQDKQALEQYTAAKKAARKAKESFEEKRPGKTPIKVLKKFPSKEAAEAHVAELEAKDAGKEKKKR